VLIEIWFWYGGFVKQARGVLLILLVCCVAAAVACLGWMRKREPEYKGKTLSEWLIAYRQPYGAVAPVISEEAAQAIRQIGTNGAPFLVKWIRESRKMPRWKDTLLALTQRNPQLPSESELRAMRAVWGFKILGPDAQAVIPDLVQVANQGNTERAPLAIGALGYLGKDALPSLLTWATNRGFQFRAAAIAATGRMGYLGTNAHPAVVMLIQCIENREFDPLAADMLGRLRVDSDLSVPALAGCLQSPNRFLRLNAVTSLGKFGEKSRGTVPELLRILSEPPGPTNNGDGPFVLQIAATNALLQIAPEVLGKSGTQ
jgi:hypothetical protein